MRPIESISMAPKSQEVSHMHQNMINKNNADKANFQGSFANEVKKNSQQTVKTNKGDNNQFLYDAKNKGNGTYYENKGDKKKKDSNKNDENHDISLSNFDVKV